MASGADEKTGLNLLTDQVIAMDCLTAAKAGIKMYAVAATEAVTPELRAVFERQLFESIDTHAKVVDYLMKKGLYHPYDVPEQIQVDLATVRTALQSPS